jgi:ketosteroid isomerase-like protein
MLTVRVDQGISAGVDLTGKLNTAREYVDAHIDALCMVDPASVPEICPVARPAAAVATATPAVLTVPAATAHTAATTSAPVAAATPDTMAIASASAPASAPPSVGDSARTALEQWRQAYENHSSEALARLYAHDASLSVVNDGARQLGWAAFEAALRDRLARATAIRVRFQDVQVHASGTTAVVSATMLRERSEAGATVTEIGLLTLVLRAPEAGRDAGWVIIAEHYSKRL